MPISRKEVRKIVQLLHDTDLTLSEIAERFRCSKSAIAAINRSQKVREYRGLRSHWVVARRTPALPGARLSRSAGIAELGE